MPKSLQRIIKNEPHKLIIFINPPYAEASSRKTIVNTGENKTQVSTTTKIYEKYSSKISTAARELFAQFFIRIYAEIPNCILGSFSTLKYINAQYYDKFKKEFRAKFLKGFMCPANTFDNVNGQFSIGFLVWNLAEKQEITKIKVDIFDESNKKIGKKNFYNIPKNKYIIDWLKNFHDKKGKQLAYLRMQGTDISNNQGCFFANELSPNDFKKHLFTKITYSNLIPLCIYLAVRCSTKRTWINDKDQFLYPKNEWQKDANFHNDCFVYIIFNENKNKISANISPSLSASGDIGGEYDTHINHFIPFSEQEVGAKEAFRSDFMTRFINGKIKIDSQKSQGLSLYEPCDFIPTKPLDFSTQAKEVFKAGLELWRYYHAQAKSSPKYLNDASLYDIKEYFQGRGESKNGKQGKLNARSEDSHYNDLLANLRLCLQDLATKIQPKIYEYEFLLE